MSSAEDGTDGSGAGGSGSAEGSASGSADGSAGVGSAGGASLTLLLLLRLPPPVRLFALDPFGSWPLSWPLSDVLADSCLGRIDCCEIDPCRVGLVPTNCCQWLSHVVPRGRPIPGFPGVIPRSRFVWTLLRSLGHVGLSSVCAGLPAALAGGAARSLTWSGGATHAAPLPFKSRDGSGQRIGLSYLPR